MRSLWSDRWGQGLKQMPKKKSVKPVDIKDVKEAVRVLRDRTAGLLKEAQEISGALAEIQNQLQEAQSLFLGGPIPTPALGVGIAPFTKSEQGPFVNKDVPLGPHSLIGKNRCSCGCSAENACLEDDCIHCNGDQAPWGCAE